MRDASIWDIGASPYPVLISSVLCFCVLAASLAAGLSVVALMTGRRLKPTLAATGELSLRYVTLG